MHPLLSKLTIAVPVYNDVRFLAATLESCVGQAGQVIIYDNASTDGSSEVAAEFAARHEYVSHVRHQENIGAFQNFKAAITACTTEYFCWVGSHDLLSSTYSVPLLTTMRSDPATALCAGTIVHIDENGEPTGEVTRSHWANASAEKSSLERAGACATGLHRDCSIFYGIYRIDMLRRAWFDTPCLGFDRAMLVRVAAIGKVAYVPEVTFYARNLDRLRDAKTDRDRRSTIVGTTMLPKNVFTRNLSMIETILAQAHTPEELNRAFYFIDRINRRYQNRRYYQRRRWLIALAVLIVIAAIVLI